MSKRTEQETNAINRVMKARGLGSLDEPGAVARLAGLVEDHGHFRALLAACDPELRRDMYEAMRPYLKFPAKSLEDYNIAAKERAESLEMPTIDENGGFHPYMVPYVTTGAINLPMPVLVEIELWARCSRCSREVISVGERRIDAIAKLRAEGWAWDEFATRHICPNCLDKAADAVDKEAGQAPS